MIRCQNISLGFTLINIMRKYVRCFLISVCSAIIPMAICLYPLVHFDEYLDTVEEKRFRNSLLSVLMLILH
jgi:hypothetical protein